MGDQIGTSIATRYSPIRLLGAGGMSRVWLARDELLERDVALKVSHFGDDADLEREAHVLAGLRHPNIVSLFDVTEADGQTYLVMEYIDGRSLAELLAERGPMPEARAVHLGQSLADALEYAHGKGVLHNDIKPANVLIDAAGEPHIADFGVASAIRNTLSLGAASELVGTLPYLAPEVIGGAQATPASDVYSLAVTLYECVAGRVPVPAGSLAGAIQRIGRVAPPVREFAPTVSVRLERILARALSAEPRDRYRTASALAAALAPSAPTIRVQRAAPARARLVAVSAVHRKRRWPAGVLLGVLGGALLLAGGILWANAGSNSHASGLDSGTAPAV
ncbi:MAG TPA: serine/threonine-protein kinase, partial [Tepidiformaceae bacterium]|nr:serine/threonine-protein kinase [Tepidiformaceae bacterium]